jgi:threonine dehydrogenase-like Zn-dependent dehydrogenase
MGESAKVAWLESPRRLAWREEALAPDGSAHLCKTLVSAISPGTELAAWTGAPALRPGKVYPRLMGYCNVAEVLRSPADATRAAPGDRVLSFASHRSMHMLNDADVLAIVPPALDAGSASIAYLLHLGYNAVLHAAVRPGSRVLVLGLGPLGLASVIMARLAGADVAALSDSAALADHARDAGAAWAGARAAIADAPAWAKAADVVIATTNGWADWQLALSMAGQRAVIAVLGFPGRGEGPPPFNPLPADTFYLKQLRIEAVGMSPEQPDSRGFQRFNERENLAFILSLLLAGRIDPTPFTAWQRPADALAEVYASLENRAEGQLTCLLTW